MSFRLTKIDDLTRPDHYHLSDQDDCYFFGEYSSGKGFSYSETNQLIYNFKKTVDRRGRAEWVHKERAILTVGRLLRTAFKPEHLPNVVWIPVPPSKARTDPLYDDRMTRALQIASGLAQPRFDIRELITQVTSIGAAHAAVVRPTPQELYDNYQVDAALTNPLKPTVVIADDVLTTGSHFVAMKRRILEVMPNSAVYGIFIARRAPEAFDFPDL